MHGLTPVGSDAVAATSTGAQKEMKRGYQPESRTMWFHLQTMYIFTKGDFKSVVMPQSVFAIAAAIARSDLGTAATDHQFGISHIAWRLSLMVSWLWIHLLIEDISNQRLPGSVVEDSVNKSWRPMPSGRLTFGESQQILRFLVVFAAIASLLLGCFEPSLLMLVLIWLYNDLDGGNASPWQRNVLNAMGLSCFGWGAFTTLTADKGGLEGKEWLRGWAVLMAVVIMTTIHAQDFPDLAGDAARGRITIPLRYGEAWARGALASFTLLWSGICLTYWNVDTTFVWLTVLGLGVAIAFTTLFRQQRQADEVVWRLWCVWVTFLYTLPMFGKASSQTV